MLVLGNKNISVEISVAGVKIKSTDSVELLGINIDNTLSFSEHIKTLCSITKNRIWSLNRICCLVLSFDQQNLIYNIFNAYIMSMFKYAPII